MNKEESGDIYPASSSFDSLGLSRDEWESLASGEGTSEELLFSLGNYFIRKQEPSRAIDVLLLLLEGNPRNALACNNLAYAYRALGDEKRAVTMLARATREDPSLVLPLIQRASIYRKRGSISRAMECYKRVLRLDGEHVVAHVELGDIYEARGEPERAIFHFKKALGVEPENVVLKKALGRIDFHAGRELFEKADFEGAFSLWADSRNAYGPVVWEDKDLSSHMRKLIEDFKKRRLLEGEIKKHEERYTASGGRSGNLYKVVLYFLFTVELVDECYLALENADAACSFWRGRAEEKGKLPYAHFRLGIVLLLQGLVEDALEEFRLCSEICPPKKHYSMRLGALIGFARMLRDRERVLFENLPSTEKDAEWRRVGFENPFEINKWRNAGFRAEEAISWRHEGISPSDAKEWSRSEIDPGLAAEWIEAGFRSADEARPWIRASVMATEARPWRECFGEDTEIAVQCRLAGFPDPDVAREWMAEFELPLEAAKWLELGFTPEEAANCRARGVVDPYSAVRKRSG